MVVIFIGGSCMGSQSSDKFTSKVSLNMVTNVVRTVLMAVIGLLMVPYYIGEFGLAAYAILPLATSLTSYFISIADSLSSVFTRYLVIALQKDDSEDANRVFSTTVIGMSGMMMVLVPIALAISIASPYIFNIGPAAALDVQLLFLMVITSSLIVSYGSCITSVFMAYNELYITYSGRIVHVVSQTVFVILFFVLFGPSLTMVGFSYILSVLLYVAIILHHFRKMDVGLKLSRGYYNGALLKEMGALGIWAVIAELGALLFIQASLILVNLSLGSEIQGSFSIVANVISMVNTACASIAVTATPLVYHSYSEGDRKKMLQTLKLFSKFVGVILAFPMAFLLVFSPQVLEMWLGEGFNNLIPMLYLMIPAQIAVCTTYPLLQVPVLYKKVRKMAFLTLFIGLSNVVVALLLLTLTNWGVYGVGLAWTITTLVLRVVVYPLYSSHLIGISTLELMKPLVWSYMMFIISLIICYGISVIVQIPATWFAVISSLLIVFIIYVLTSMKLIFNKSEREETLSYFPGPVRNIIKKVL